MLLRTLSGSRQTTISPRWVVYDASTACCISNSSDNAPSAQAALQIIGLCYVCTNNALMDKRRKDSSLVGDAYQHLALFRQCPTDRRNTGFSHSKEALNLA